MPVHLVQASDFAQSGEWLMMPDDECKLTGVSSVMCQADQADKLRDMHVQKVQMASGIKIRPRDVVTVAEVDMCGKWSKQALAELDALRVMGFSMPSKAQTAPDLGVASLGTAAKRARQNYDDRARSPCADSSCVKRSKRL